MENNGGFDLHVHTDFSSMNWIHEVKYSPELAVKKAKECGLDGLAITDHDSIGGLSRALNAAEKNGIIVVPGVELTAKHFGLPRHIIALGIDPDITKTVIEKHSTIEDTLKWIHDNDGIAIAAHPNLDIKHRKKFPISLTSMELKKNAALLDGVEVITPYFGYSQKTIDWGKDNNKALIASSDAHTLDQIGVVRTEIFKDVKNWKDVVNAIKEKQTTPFISVPVDELSKYSYRHQMMKQILNS